MENLEQNFLQKYLDAQIDGYGKYPVYEEALREILLGQKKSDWIWYVFPIIADKRCGELS